MFESADVGLWLALALLGSFVEGVVDDWEGEGALRMRSRCLNDVCLETPVEGRLLFALPSAGVGGKGPRGGGKGASPGSGEAGIEFNRDSRELTALDVPDRV